MCKKFLKLNIENEINHEGDWLAFNHPNAFILLYYIARRARRIAGHPDGLNIGECHLGDWKAIGLSRQNYRTALKILCAMKIIEITETNRTRKKSTTGITTEGTKVKLLNSTIWDINPEVTNHQTNHCLTTDQPLPNHELRRDKKDKNEKEDHPSIPSFGLIDDFSFDKEKIEIITGVFLSKNELDTCIKIKGSEEKVKHAIEFIQTSDKRKHPIKDWPNALAKWKIDDKTTMRIQDHVSHSEKLIEEFPEHKNGRGWRCYLHNDKKKDQRGLVFEHITGFQEGLFIALTDAEFHRKCEEFIKTKNMRQK
jgi:hypothetical protein